MELRGAYSYFFNETMLPALNAKIWQTFKAKRRMYDLLLDTDTTGRSIEQYAQMTGVGLPTLVNEGEDTPTDTMVQGFYRSEEHTSELQSLRHLVCRLLLEKKQLTSLLHALIAISPGPSTDLPRPRLP